MNKRIVLILLTLLVIFIITFLFFSSIVDAITVVLIIGSIPLVINNIKLIPSIIMFILTHIMVFNITGNRAFIILLYLVAIYFFSTIIQRQQLTFSGKSTTYWIYFFYSWYFIGVFYFVIGEKLENTWLHIISFTMGILIIWLFNRVVINKRDLKLIYLFWGLFIIFSIVIGLWEIFTNNSLLDETSNMEFNGATVIFFNRNNYSFLLGISLPVFFFWLKEKKIFKVLGIFAIFSIFYIVYINNTRSVLIVISIVLVFYLTTYLRRLSNLILGAFLLIIISIMTQFNFLFKHINKLYNSVIGLDESTNIRFKLSKSAIDIFKDYPFFGVGPGNSDYYMLNIGDKIHNFFLETLVNYGIFVFTGLIVFFLYSTFSFIKQFYIQKEHIFNPLLLSILIFIPVSLTPSSIFRFQILWFLFGIILVSLSIIKRERKNSKTEFKRC